MISSTQIDLEGLVAPISPESPTGTDPGADESPDNDYRSLKDARTEAGRIERRDEGEGIETGEAMPFWRAVRDRAQTVLSSQAKDLRAACYLVEAWVRLDGFAGLRAGVSLLRELVQQYWEDLYPRPEEDGELSERTKWLDNLADSLPKSLLRVPITGEGSAGAFAAWQFKQAKDLESAPSADREERIARGAATMEQVKQSANDTELDFYRVLNADLAWSLEELEKLDRLLNERCGAFDAPSTSSVKETIEQIQSAVRDLAGTRLEAAVAAAESSTEGETGEAGAGGATAGGVSIAVGAIRSREDAFRTLEQVALFFERMDPQSLLAYHIKRIVRLGKMSPAEYYSELLEDDNTRDRLFKQVGIEPPQNTD